MKIPKAVSNLIEAFEKLPGIGPKTAARLTYYLLQAPPRFSESFAEVLISLHKETKVCSTCNNIADTDPCEICSGVSRDKSSICVVEKPLDIISLERSGKYVGLYHVLGGVISPLNNIGPDELSINNLLGRIRSVQPEVKEIILATNANLEGEATSMYLSKLLKQEFPEIKVTRIGRGLPVGSDLEYADDITLLRAMEGRQEYL